MQVLTVVSGARFASFGELEDVLAEGRKSPAGTTITYQVERDGVLVTRSGMIGQFDSRFVWVSGWLHFRDEMRNIVVEKGRG